MRTNKILSLFWIIIAIVLCFILFSNLKGKGTPRIPGIHVTLNGKDFISEKPFETMTFSQSEVNDINIDVASEAVFIRESADSKIVVELYCDGNNIPSVEVSNNVLKISKTKKRIILNGNQFIVVKLPRNFNSNNIEVSTASGSIHYVDIKTSVAYCTSASGSIHFEDCEIEDVEAKSASGSIHLNNCNIENLVCNSQSGSLHLDGEFNKINAHSLSGSIRVSLLNALKYDSEFQTTSGSINLDVPYDCNMNINYSLNSGSYKNEITGTSGKKGRDVIGTSGPDVNLKTTSGSIRIH